MYHLEKFGDPQGRFDDLSRYNHKQDIKVVILAKNVYDSGCDTIVSSNGFEFSYQIKIH